MEPSATRLRRPLRGPSRWNRALLFLLALASAFARADAQSCGGSITFSPTAAWSSGGSYFQQWTIVLANNGGCTISNVNAFFGIGGSSFSYYQSYNYDTTSGAITGMASGQVTSGDTYSSAGFTVTGPSPPPTPTVTQITCTSTSCITTTTTTTQPPAATTTTTRATTTAAPVSTTTTRAATTTTQTPPAATTTTTQAPATTTRAATTAPPTTTTTTTTTATPTAPPQLAPTAASVGFNGSASGCGASENTTYLTTPTQTTSYPRPLVQISYAANTKTLYFAANATYSPQYSRYVLGFAPFDPAANATLRNPAQGSSINGAFYSGAAFSGWWSHAPNALGAAAYASQLAGGSGGAWTVSPNGCSGLQFTGAFTVQDLSALRSKAGGRLVTYTNSSGGTTMSGTLYVALVSPASYSAGENGGYNTIEWPLKFSVYISTNTASVVVSQSGPSVAVVVTAVSAAPGGNLQVALQTSEVTQGGQYPNGILVFSSSSGPVALALQSAAPSTVQASPVYQTFTFTSPAVPANGDYTGTYAFAFTAYQCTGASFPSSCPYSGQVTVSTWVSFTVPPPASFSVSYASNASMYASPSFDAPLTSAPLLAGTQVCVKDVIVDTGGAAGLVAGLVIQDVYICSAGTAGGRVSYDGLYNFGCLNATNAAKVVSAGVVATGAYVSDFYRTALYQGLDALSAGVCFAARTEILDTTTLSLVAPLSAQFVHISATVTLTVGSSRRRGAQEAEDLAHIVAPLSSFVVVTSDPLDAPARTQPPARPGGEAELARLAPVAVGAGIPLLALLVGCVGCCCCFRRAEKRGDGGRSRQDPGAAGGWKHV